VIQTAQLLCAEADATRARSREILARSNRRRSHELSCPVERNEQQPVDSTRVARPALTDGPSSVVVTVMGEIDMAGVPALSVELDTHLGSAGSDTDLIVDLSDVTFIDLHALSLLLTATRTARSRGVSLRLVGRPRCLLRLLQITGAAEGLNLQ